MLRNSWLGLGWLWVVTVFFLSLMPIPPQPYAFEFSDKLNHALAYSLLMLWFCQLYAGKARIKLLLLLLAMGVLIEILQGMTGYRYFEFADMLANTAGVLLGLGLAKMGAEQILAALERKLGSEVNK